MLKYVNGMWTLCPYRINYTQHGEQLQAYDVITDWWESFARTWDHTTIDSIELVEYTEAQQQRHAQIRHMPEDFGDVYERYVLDGIIDVKSLPMDASHPFMTLALSKRMEILGEGAIIESDTNSNGNYTKFANGVLMCQCEAIALDNGRILFPCGFSELPTVLIENKPEDLSYEADKSGLRIKTPSTCKLPYIVIGRWK